MKKYTQILWDFNGTLLDDVQTGIDSINVLLSRRALPTLRNREDYYQHFRFPITSYYRRVGLDLQAEDFDALAEEWMEQYLHFVLDAGLFPGVISVLERIRAEGIPQTVFSATERGLLLRQIEQLGILPFFSEVLGLDNIRAESKIALGLEWVARHPGERTLLIGDTDHDRAAAAEMGVDCVLIAGGHQPAERLQACGVPVLDCLENLPEYIFGETV